MSEDTSFIARALAGEILDVDDAIDDAVDDWHERGGLAEDGTPVTLHDWLGMTADEYSVFVEQPRALRAILHARRYGGTLGDIVNATDEGAVTMAARGASPEEIAALIAWLRTTGRLH